MFYKPEIYDDRKINELVDEIGINIKNERIRQHISLNKFADMTNISATHISNFENGIKTIGTASLVKAIIALNVSPDIIIPIEKSCEMERYAKKFLYIIQDMKPEAVNYLLQLLEEFAKQSR